MGASVESLSRAWRSAGAFSIWNQPLGAAKRASLGALKTIDLIASPFSPNGTRLERYRLGLLEGKALNAPELAARERTLSGLSPDNFIHEFIALEAPLAAPHQVFLTYGRLKNVVEKLRQKADQSLTPEQKLRTIYGLIKEEGAGYIGQEDSLFVDSCSSAKLDCDTSSYFVLAAAREMKWPVSLQWVPDHVFVRWDDGKNVLNMDQGVIFEDKYYLEKYQVDELRTLGRSGVLANTCNVCAVVQINRGEIEAACKKLEAALFLAPWFSLTRDNLGLAKLFYGGTEEAVEDFNWSLRLSPRDAKALYLRGDCYYHLERYQEAIDDYDAAVGLRPELRKEVNYRELAGDLLAKQRAGDGSYPTEAIANFRLGRIKCLLGRYEEAVEYFQLAQEQGFKFTESSLRLFYREEDKALGFNPA